MPSKKIFDKRKIKCYTDDVNKNKGVETMTILETLIIGMIQLSLIALLVAVVGVLYYILEKIGFNRWLRGWLWYFGLIDECPDTKRDR